MRLAIQSPKIKNNHKNWQIAKAQVIAQKNMKINLMSKDQPTHHIKNQLKLSKYHTMLSNN